MKVKVTITLTDGGASRLSQSIESSGLGYGYEAQNGR